MVPSPICASDWSPKECEFVQLQVEGVLFSKSAAACIQLEPPSGFAAHTNMLPNSSQKSSGSWVSRGPWVIGHARLSGPEYRPKAAPEGLYAPPPVPGSAELSHSILTSLGFSFFLLGHLGSSWGGSCQKEFPPNPGQGRSRQYKSFGSYFKHTEIRTESFGIVVPPCGYCAGYFGLGMAQL